MAAENKQAIISPDVEKLMEAHANNLQDINQISDVMQCVRIDRLVSDQAPEDLLISHPDPNVIVPSVHTPRLPAETIKTIREAKEKQGDVDTLEVQVNAIAGNRMRNDQRTGTVSQATRVELEFLERYNRARTEYDSRRPQYLQAENEHKQQLERLNNNKAKYRAKVKEAFERLAPRLRPLFPQNFLTLSPDEQLILIDQVFAMKKLAELKTSTDLQTAQTRAAKAALLDMESHMKDVVDQLITANKQFLPSGTDIDTFRAAVEKCVTDQTHQLYLSAEQNFAKLIYSAVVATTEDPLDQIDDTSNEE